jgi:hypothetical protein
MTSAVACSRAALARLHRGDSVRMGEAKVLLEGPNRVSGPTYIHDKRLFQPPLNDSGPVLS